MPSQQKQIIKQEGDPNNTKTFALKGREPHGMNLTCRKKSTPVVVAVPVEGGAIGIQSCNINWLAARLNAIVAFDIRNSA